RLEEGIQSLWYLIFPTLVALLILSIGLLWVQTGKSRERKEKIQAIEKAEKQERGKNLALRLYQAKMHDLTKIYGSNLAESADGIRREISLLSNADGRVYAECQRKLEELK